VIRKKE